LGEGVVRMTSTLNLLYPLYIKVFCVILVRVAKKIKIFWLLEKLLVSLHSLI
jgi:hypothetical protein